MSDTPTGTSDVRRELAAYILRYPMNRAAHNLAAVIEAALDELDDLDHLVAQDVCRVMLAKLREVARV